MDKHKKKGGTQNIATAKSLAQFTVEAKRFLKGFNLLQKKVGHCHFIAKGSSFDSYPTYCVEFACSPISVGFLGSPKFPVWSKRIEQKQIWSSNWSIAVNVGQNGYLILFFLRAKPCLYPKTAGTGSSSPLTPERRRRRIDRLCCLGKRIKTARRKICLLPNTFTVLCTCSILLLLIHAGPNLLSPLLPRFWHCRGRNTSSRFPSADVTLLDRHLFMYHGHTIKFSLGSI